MSPEEVNALVNWIHIGVNVVFIIIIIPIIIYEIKDIMKMKKMKKELDEKLRDMIKKR